MHQFIVEALKLKKKIFLKLFVLKILEMTKFVVIFVFLSFIAIIQATPVVKRDVLDFTKPFVPGHIVYGNGIPAYQAEIVDEHSQIDGNGNYDFG